MMLQRSTTPSQYGWALGIEDIERKAQLLEEIRRQATAIIIASREYGADYTTGLIRRPGESLFGQLWHRERHEFYRISLRNPRLYVGDDGVIYECHEGFFGSYWQFARLETRTVRKLRKLRDRMYVQLGAPLEPAPSTLDR